MRLLSSRRRHPAAKALLLVAGLFMMGALYSVMAPPAQVSADTGNSQQIAEGKALFAVGCASCHGLNGEGQVDAPIQGPPLAGVGAAAVDFQVSTGRMPMAKPGHRLRSSRTITPRKRSQHSRRTSRASARVRRSPTRPSTTPQTSALRILPEAASCSAPTALRVTTSRAPVAHSPTASTRHR